MATQLLLSVLLLLGSVQQQAGRNAIEGQVIRADSDTPAPIAQVRVVLARTQVAQTPTGPRYSEVAVTRTDSAGLFRLEGIPAGSYLLLANAEGFVTGQYGQRAANRPGAPLTVPDGGLASPIVFKLTPTATITGIVRDFDNEPMADVTVQVSKIGYSPDGQRTLTPASSTTTDDRGVFRLYWVTPDEYVVSASLPVVVAGGRLQVRNPSLPPAKSGYSATYYPGVTDVSRALSVKVQPGQTLDGITFHLVASPTRNLSGTVTDSRTGNPVRAVLQLISAVRGAGTIARTSQSNETGKYEFRGVPAGSYSVIAVQLPDEAALGVGTVDLQDKDVSGFNLSLKVLGSLRGRIVVEGGGALPNLTRVNIGFVPPAGAPPLPGGNNGGPITADGAFEITSVLSGTFELRANGIPPEYFVKSARLGGTDAWNVPVTVSGSTSDTLEIVLSTGVGSVRGTVADAKGVPLASSYVVLIPESRLRGKFAYYKTATTDQNGNFTLRGIPPGEYTLFAWDYIEGNAFYNPEFIREQEPKGMPVTVEANKESTARVTVIQLEN
jgi:Carboxypeptidase regulatory-like domain